MPQRALTLRKGCATAIAETPPAQKASCFVQGVDKKRCGNAVLPACLQAPPAAASCVDHCALQKCGLSLTALSIIVASLSHCLLINTARRRVLC